MSSGDARYWYFRGLAESATGDTRAAEKSITRGANLEREGSPDVRTVGIAMYRVQGPSRHYLNGVVEKVYRNAPPRQNPYR